MVVVVIVVLFYYFVVVVVVVVVVVMVMVEAVAFSHGCRQLFVRNAETPCGTTRQVRQNITRQPLSSPLTTA